jgi:lipoate-protein ligase B
MSPCDVFWLGTVPYKTAWDLQRVVAGRVAQGEIPDTLLLLEHPHVYTLGGSGHRENLLISEEERARKGIQVEWVDRGGDITYHGPGQLVGYPILALGTPDHASGRLPQADYVGYLRRLERVIIAAVSRFGLVAGQLPGKTGVWVQADMASRCPSCPAEKRKAPSKIASLGVKVNASGVSQHGFALNVRPTMEYWKGIVACGLHGYQAISMAELLGEEAPEVKTVAESVVESFGQVFGYQMIWRAAEALGASAPVPVDPKKLTQPPQPLSRSLR